MTGWILQRIARRRGGQDGRLNHPALDDPNETPGVILGLARRTTQRLGEIAQAWHLKDRKLKAEECHLRGDRQRAEALSARAHRDRDEAEQRLASRRADLEADRSERRASGDKSPDWRLPGLVYVGLLVVLAVGEERLNSQVLLVLGLSERATRVMTWVIVGSLLIAAHGLGALLRREQPARVERMMVRVALIFPFIYALLAGIIRGGYARATNSSTVFGLSPLAVAVALGGLNLLLYFAATLASYLAHHSGHDEVRAAEREVTRQKLKANLARGREREAAKKHDQARSRRDNTWRATLRLADRVVAFGQRLMEAYVAGNVTRRKDHRVAMSLRPENLPPIVLPETLREPLDWECPGAAPTPLVATGHVPLQLPSGGFPASERST